MRAFRQKGTYGRPWTAEEDATLVELRRQGLGLFEIAAKMGRSRQSVKHRAAKHIAAGTVQIMSERRPWTTHEERILAARRRANVPLDAIARELGRSKHSIVTRCTARKIDGPRRLYTEAELARLRQMVEQGWALKVIADTLKRPKRGLGEKIRRIGLSTSGCRRRVA